MNRKFCAVALANSLKNNTPSDNKVLSFTVTNNDGFRKQM